MELASIRVNTGRKGHFVTIHWFNCHTTKMKMLIEMAITELVESSPSVPINFQVSLLRLIDELTVHLSRWKNDATTDWLCDEMRLFVCTHSIWLVIWQKKTRDRSLISFYSIRARVWCINSIVGGSKERWQSDTDWRSRGENELHPRARLSPCLRL